MGGIHRREIETGSDTCLLGYSGRDSVDSAVFDAAYLEEGGGNEVQTVTVDATGGTFTLTFKDQTTAAIAENASAAVVQAALRALSRIGSDGATVTGSAGGPYTVEFTGRHGRKDVPLMTANDDLLTGGAGTVTVAETTKGSALNAGLYVLDAGLVLTRVGNKVRPYTGEGNTDEVQTATVNGSPTGGTFTLEYDGEQTAAIAYNAAASAVQTALEGLPNVDPGDVAVTGSAGGPYTITFGGGLGGQSVSLIETNDAGLTGGTNPSVTVAQTTQGGTTEEICGIFDGHREFFDNTNLSDKEIPVYNKFCVFNKKKVQNYDDYEDALEAWGRENDCHFRSQGANTY